jgi:hypothetical protein
MQKMKHISIKVEIRRKIRRISPFLCGFLVALDLSAVPLYGDE